MITQIDFKILDFIQAGATPVLDRFFAVITHLGDKGVFWIALALILFCFRRTRRCSVMMMIALVAGLIIGNGALKHLIARARPFIQNPDMLAGLVISPPDGFSCPSGHTLASFEAATVIFLNNKKWGVPALVLAALIGFSRNYLYVHFLSDVLFGAVLGVAIAILTVYLYRRYAVDRIDNFKQRNEK